MTADMTFAVTVKDGQFGTPTTRSAASAGLARAMLARRVDKSLTDLRLQLFFIRF